jgi:hypothetical protein
MNRIELIIGDWSGDGHERTDKFIIDSNLNKNEIVEAYERGVDIIGFDLSTDVCDDYEDHYMPLDKYATLTRLGFIYPREYDGDAINIEGDAVYMHSELFAYIYLFFVKKGNDQFDFSMIKFTTENSIPIGGYGLF